MAYYTRICSKTLRRPGRDNAGEVPGAIDDE
jgi:hypothetical protein